ncbi:MAG: hypothetical protein AAGA69_07030, partial [Pseudomonadota bacterium]
FVPASGRFIPFPFVTGPIPPSAVAVPWPEPSDWTSRLPSPENLPMLKSPVAALLTIFLMPGVAQAQNDAAFVNPCTQGVATDFDYWVGDWVAFDSNTGEVQGIDRIETINNGCTLFQDWRQMTDRYRSPDAPYRYAGISFSYVDGAGVWHQTWVSNGGGPITLKGGLDDKGTMTLRTEEAPGRDNNFFYRVWRWEPQEDGSIRSWGEIFVRPADGDYADEPVIPWDIRYVRRADAPVLVPAADSPAE